MRNEEAAQPRAEAHTRYAPTPDEIAAMHRHFTDRRDELVRAVQEIEGLLGFVVQSEDLAVRVAKIENFLGIKA